MPWIFSYADLGPANITSVLPSAPFVALPATLENHRILFKGKSRKWGGGLATAERKKGAVTYGSVYLVPESEVKLIDRYYKVYEKVAMKVSVAATGDQFKAYTYVLKKGDETAPSDEYCKALAKHLKFFWGQGGKKLNLADFGITTTPAPPKAKPKAKEAAKPTKAKPKQEKQIRKPVRRKAKAKTE